MPKTKAAVSECVKIRAVRESESPVDRAGVGPYDFEKVPCKQTQKMPCSS